MYMYNWFTLLYTWNKHNIVNELLSNKEKKQKKPTADSIHNAHNPGIWACSQWHNLEFS